MNKRTGLGLLVAVGVVEAVILAMQATPVHRTGSGSAPLNIAQLHASDQPAVPAPWLR